MGIVVVCDGCGKEITGLDAKGEVIQMIYGPGTSFLKLKAIGGPEHGQEQIYCGRGCIK